MYILGIETATMTGSVALLTEDRLMAEYTLHSGVTHTERLLSAIDDLMQATGLTMAALDAIAVSKGPGSFTGLRIGVTTAKSLAYSLQTPVVAIPSLDALAAQYVFTSMLLCPILDARKREVYTAFYRNTGAAVHRVSDYAVIAPDLVLQAITEPVLFLGDGVFRYRETITTALGALAHFADAAHGLPRAGLIAQLAALRLQHGDTDQCFDLTPLYIRQSDAEIHWKPSS